MGDESPWSRNVGLVSFFAGCGILDLGFEQSGFEPILVNEYEGEFARAYRYSREVMGIPTPKCGIHVASIEEFMTRGEGRQPALEEAMAMARRDGGAVGFVGGPPCPDFSIAGKQAGSSGENGRLTQDYFDLIGILRPDFFLFENVKGLYSTRKHREFFEGILKGAQQDGYAITTKLVNAIDYGTPQDRHRVIVIGFHREAFPGGEAERMAETFEWDRYATHAGLLKSKAWPRLDLLHRHPETGEVFDEGRPPPPGMDERHIEVTAQHWFELNQVDEHPNAKDIFRVKAGLANFRASKEGDTRRKSFKRLHRWRYSPTAAYGNNEVHLHPYKDRRLSVAEAMALQSLPANFALPSDMTLSDKFKTIGNGVPFRLAGALAWTIREMIGEQAAQPITLDADRGRTPIPVPPEQEEEGDLIVDTLPPDVAALFNMPAFAPEPGQEGASILGVENPGDAGDTAPGSGASGFLDYDEMAEMDLAA